MFANWANSGESIIFFIPIETEIFSGDAALTVRLWNAKQLEISEKTSNCAASFDLQTQTEEIQCPEGVEYQKPIPEEFLFPIEEIELSIEIISSTVQIGERYRVHISGLSHDDCNTASASVNGEVTSKALQLNDLSWTATRKACL